MKFKLGMLLLILMLLSGCGHYSTITGTVIDAETMKPIEGAVVMAEWTKQVGLGNYHTESVKVIEAVTDLNGKVTLEGIFNIMVDPPTFVIYKPGYVTWSSRSTWPVHSYRVFRWEDQTFKLERFKPEYSYIKHSSFFNSAIRSTIGTNNKKLIRKTYDDTEREKCVEEANKINELKKKERGEIK